MDDVGSIDTLNHVQRIVTWNHLGSSLVVRAWDQEVCYFAPSVVSGSSHVVAYMMATGGLYGR
jgi:hypothetical protein